MLLLESIGVAVSTYSIIPVPQFPWTERNTRYAICCFPVVGIFCGGGLALWYWLCRWMGGSGVLFAAAAACLPLLITGGIHMDGFMDTVDALASHQSRERKLEILKDSACGAFAVLYCGVYLLLSFALYYEGYAAGWIYAFAPAFVLSRCLSGLCAVTMPNARRAGMLCAFTAGVERKRAVAALALVLLADGALLLFLSPVVGGAVLACALVSVLCYRRMAMGEFGGVTGDTSGFFLQICELAMLAGAWIGGRFL